MTTSAFDPHASSYDDDLQRGLALSGESKDYFARQRVAWLRACLADAPPPRVVLDFGCGTGSTTPLLQAAFGADIVGVDTSEALLARARASHGSSRVMFFTPDAWPDELRADLAYCNGVFHHIVPAGRAEQVAFVHRVLTPGGAFAFWENNPWNPGTRLVMRRIPFDRDAVMLSAPEAQRLLRAGGFEVARTDFQFIFPSGLRALRGLEPALSRLPLGAQYQVLARRATP